MLTEEQKLQFERLLRQSVDSPYPQESNELDWKGALSSKTERLKEHLSAFSNYSGGGYLAFGIEDDGNVIGISAEEAKGVTQKLGSIAREGLEPAISLGFYQMTFRGKVILGVQIPESLEKPVHKRGSSLEHSFIRSNGTTRKMSTQELRISLIGSRSLRFEELPAAVSPEVAGDLTKYFDFTEINKRLRRAVSDRDSDVDFLHANKLLTKSGDRYLPTNLCVLCAAKDLGKFPGYERYAVRVTRFVGRSRLSTKGDEFFSQGYSLSLDRIIEHIIGQLPYNEIVKRATRIEVPLIPENALREIIANSVIHRDYSKTASYITIDIFDDRIEVTNPGTLLPNIRVDRLIDHPSETRNEVLADLMRKLRFCEEEGTGIDKAVAAMEMHGLPPLKFTSQSDFFRVSLFAPKEFNEMEKEERIEAVYQHASLNFVSSKKTTNSSIRERFHFDERHSTKVTRLLTDAVDAERIRLANPKASPRDMHYVPYWAPKAP